MVFQPYRVADIIDHNSQVLFLRKQLHQLKCGCPCCYRNDIAVINQLQGSPGNGLFLRHHLCLFVRGGQLPSHLGIPDGASMCPGNQLLALQLLQVIPDG